MKKGPGASVSGSTSTGGSLLDATRGAPGAFYQFQVSPDGTYAIPFASPEFAARLEIELADPQETATRFFSRVHPVDLPRLSAAIAESARTLQMFECEFRIRRRPNADVWLEARSNPSRLPDGSVLWNGIVTDITGRKSAEDDLRQSERRLRSLFENMLEGYVYCRMIYEDGRPSDFACLHVNEAFDRLTHLKDVVGRRISDVIPGIQRTNPELFETCGRVVATGQPEAFEVFVAGLGIWFSISAYQPEPGCFVAVFSDVSARKRHEQEIGRLNRLYATLSSINQTTVQVQSREELFEAVCRVAATHAGYHLVWIGRLDPESSEVRPVGGAGVQRSYLDRIRVYADDRPLGRGPVGTCIREAKPSVVNDFLGDPAASPWRQAAMEFSLAAAAAVPIRFRGVVWGALAVYAGEAGIFKDEEVALLQEAAAAISTAMERLEGEKALRASEVRYRRLFESAKDGILILDASTGMVVDVNPFLIELLGYSHADFLGKKVWELGFFSDIVANHAAFLELQRRDYIRFEDKPLKTSDGRRVDVEFVSNVYLVADQKVIQCNIRDISDRKRAEIAQNRLATAVEQAAETIVITDAAGTIVYVNPAFEKACGYSREEALGANPRIQKSGKHDASFYRQLWAVLGRGDVWRGRLVNKRKDGTLFEEDATISPVRDATGTVVNYVAVKRDVTREVQLEEQLRQSQKMDAIGHLAGGVAHDFNNLLTVINGYGEILVSSLLPEDPRQASAREIVSAGSRAAGLTRQLLAFSRKQVLAPKVLNLNDVLSGMERMIRRLIGEDIELESNFAPDLALVMADPGQMEQVLMNLALNARDAMPTGGRLTLETKNASIDEKYAESHADIRSGPHVMIAVSDTGTGMDPATLSQIFEPFFTTKDVGKGTGLGLATVYGIVKQSGGHIWAYSEPGLGTTIKVYLPRAEGPRRPSRPFPAVEGPPRGTETILVVEDDEALGRFIHEVLTSNGYRVLAATCGEDALAISSGHPEAIPLLVTDVVMPRMSGRMVAEKLQAARPELRVLYISGYTGDAIVHHGRLDAGIEFLQKPFGPDSLARRVREVLDQPKRAI